MILALPKPQLIMPRLPRSIRAALASVWGKEENLHYNVISIIKSEATGLSRVHRAHNIITTAGDVFFAQKEAAESPTNAFANLVLYSASITPGKSSTHVSASLIASTEVAPSATYPKSNDSDTDNTGKGTTVVTRKYFYSAASFNHAAILGGAICIASPSNGGPLFAAWDYTSFPKAATDTLTCYHNSTCLGA